MPPSTSSRTTSARSPAKWRSLRFSSVSGFALFCSDYWVYKQKPRGKQETEDARIPHAVLDITLDAYSDSAFVSVLVHNWRR